MRSQLGQLLLLTNNTTGTVAKMEAVLAVDPKNAGAHFNLMRAYRVLGKSNRAEQHQRLYERFRADEEAQARARVYLDGHPDDNRERQPIHEHRSAPLPLPGPAPVPAPGAEAGR